MDAQTTGVISVEDPDVMLADVCDAFLAKADAKPELGVRVARETDEGRIDFGWGVCRLVSGPAGLTAHLEADDAAALDELCELIARHVHGHSTGQPPTIVWSHREGEDEHDGALRRDRMRAFHARMRHRHDS